MPKSRSPLMLRRNVGLFVAIACVWIVLDQATKAWITSKAEPGTVVARFGDLFQVRLVHNTGAAWSLFSDSTFALGIVSALVCAALVAAFVAVRKSASLPIVVGLALAFGGGLGNAIDRFSLGHVVDFIEATFIDFPVFNVADIGVTCGFAVLILSIALFRGHDGGSQANPRDNEELEQR